MPDSDPLPVEFDELLAAEFNYIAQTAIQANEDRARVSSFYLIAVGSLVAAMFGAQYIDSTFRSIDVNILFSGLFMLLTLLGTSTIMQLARLRSAWYESALAMNQLKDYMMSQNKTLKQAFRWKTSTLPSKYKKDSISYYQALEVALISGLMFGAAVFFLQQAILPLGSFLIILAAGIGIASVFVQLYIYQRALK
jgi:FtsH-binding integral membrane protein